MSAEKYILSIDQSTSCTKALLFDKNGGLKGRFDLPHKQIVLENGWVEHDPIEIYTNLIQSVRSVIKTSGIDQNDIVGVGISNQRETAIAWDKITGEPILNAIVWQCARGEAICKRIASSGHSETIKKTTGIPLSPYYSAAKLAWILENVPLAKEKAKTSNLCCSTMDSWLLWKLVGGSPKTDYSNASRTQLFNIQTLEWDKEVCEMFGVSLDMLPEVCDSNSLFGVTDFDGTLDKKTPVHSILGDSHGALYGQGCLNPGMTKATYGTGSSVMMNIGTKPVFSDNGIVTSLAWRMNGKVNYVLEGNINYTGAVIKWLIEDLKLIQSAKETETLAREAKNTEGLYLVPAFSGLGAPYWEGDAKAMIYGMTRQTGKAEIVRAAEECIAYQIADIVNLMGEETGIKLQTFKVDGGATKDSFLMQFQSDIVNAAVQVPDIEELSGSGPAYAAGIALGIYDERTIFQRNLSAEYSPQMDVEQRNRLYTGWKNAVSMVLGASK